MVCMRETLVAFDEFAALANNVAAAISNNDVESYKKSRDEIFRKMFLARTAMRKELGIEPLMSVSTVSSAAPIPAAPTAATK
jgi:hypothetical protein